MHATLFKVGFTQ